MTLSEEGLESMGVAVGSGSAGSMLCLLSLDGQPFALRAAAVREVIGNAMVVRIPLAPDFMEGIVNYRGVMLTTVSLRRVLGLQPSPGKSCVVVLRGGADGSESFGLLVDRLAGVVSLDSAVLEPIPPTVADKAQDVFRGMYVRDQGPLVELDADHLRPEWLMLHRSSGC